MVQSFEFHDSTLGLDRLSVERLFLPSSGFEIGNEVFRAGGIARGTLRYTDPAAGAEVTEATWQNAMGLAGTGTPVGVPPLAPGVPGSGFVGLLNGGTFGYFVLDGVDAPVLSWDDSAEGATREAALADLAANIAAARADYQAQLDAVLAQAVADRYACTVGGTAMTYRPSDGTALTYGDFFSVAFFPDDGFFALGPSGSESFGNVFAPDEAVELRLTRAGDVLVGETFSAGT